MVLFLHHPRQSPNPSDFDSSSFFSSSTPSTQFPTSSPLSTTSAFESRTDTNIPTTTTTHDPSTFTSTTPTSTFNTNTFSTSSTVSLSSLVTSSFLPSSSLSASPSTTPPPSSSSPTLHVSSSSSTPMTTYVTDINGVLTTIVTPVVTALHGATSAQNSPRPAIIAGSAIGGLVLFCIGLSAIFIYRRRVRRQRYWALSRKRIPSRSTFLAGESMDLPQPTSPYAYADNDDPFSTHVSRHPVGSSSSPPPSSYPYASAYAYEPDSPPRARTSSPVSSSPPLLFRARASESGSIFREGVWPPPSAASQLTDPLTSPSHAVDLGSIVNDVMGPTSDESGGLGRGSGSGPTREGSGASSETNPLLAEALAAGAVDVDYGPDADAVPALTLTNPDPGSPLSPLQPPHTPPRPPQWLSRSPNPSPKNSPLHRPHPL